MINELTLPTPNTKRIPPMDHAAMTMPARQTSIDAALLPALIERYIAEKSDDGSITSRTKINYENQLNPWRAFWEQRPDIHENQLSAPILRAALDWMRNDYRTRLGQPPAANSVEHCWTRLRQVFLWAFTCGCTGQINLCDWTPRVEHVESQAHFPDLAEIAALIAQPAGDYRLRDIAIIAYAVSTGARRFEIAQARAELTTWATPPTNITVGADHSGWTHLYQVKGDREGRGAGRVVCFDTIAGLLIKVYLRTVARSEGAIFGMSDTGLGQMIDRHARAAGVPEISPHGFRRLFSDHWDEVHGMAGRFALKKQLGHNLDKSQDVTERHYIGRNPKRVAREISKWHVSPLADLAWDWERYPVNIVD